MRVVVFIDWSSLIILGLFGCALCAGGVLTGTLARGACQVGDILGGETELCESWFLLTDC